MVDNIDIKKFQENKEMEQYFFTENVLINLVEALTYEDDILCLCTPAVADAFYRLKERVVVCLDIDERFNYLPGFVKYDVLNPVELDYFKPKVIIIDPPFFKMNLLDLFKTVEVITKGDKSTKIIFAFVQRDEKSLLYSFKSYNLQPTKFKLEYQSVDPTKWDNYCLYSNCEFNKIKFLKKKK
jgi:hypothetical protein